MKLAGWIALGVGLALLAAVVAATDLEAVARALLLVGWGVVWLVAARLLVHVIDAWSWHVLLPPAGRPHFLRLCWMWLVGDAVNALLPVAQVGGELVRARLLARSPIGGPLAAASVVVGITLSVLTLVMFAALGAALLVGARGPESEATALGIGSGVAALGLLLAGFYVAQRNGLFLKLAQLLERATGGRDWLALSGGAATLDALLQEFYGRRRLVLSCGLWRFLGWAAGAVEVWLALQFLGYKAGFVDAFVLESLGQVVRSAGFAIPGALGVQEGSFLLLGAALGMPAEVAVGVALLKRVRDLLLGLPLLLSWHWYEAAALRRRPVPAGNPGSGGDKRA